MSRDIEIALIDRDEQQPRKRFDENQIRELAQSIEANGLIQPITVKATPAGRYAIVAGERRYRAVTLLGWEAIPANVVDLDDDAATWWALVENIQRTDLTPIEEAEAYQRALSGGITQTALGERVGKSQSYIANKLRLLALPRYIQTSIAEGTISEGHAKQLMRLKDNGEALMTLHAALRDGRRSVAETKTMVDRAFVVIELIAAMQRQEWGQADAIFATLPDAPQGFGCELLLRYATDTTEHVYTQLPDYRPVARTWDGEHEPSKGNQIWLDTFGALYVIETYKQDDWLLQWAMQLRMASVLEAGEFPFVCSYLMGLSELGVNNEQT